MKVGIYARLGLFPVFAYKIKAVAKPGLKGWSCTYFSMQSIQLWYQYKGQDYFSNSAKCPKYHKNKAKLNAFCGI